LANNKFFPVLETVALPPDTENQTVIYTSLAPKPVEVTVDTDGNYLAKYRLNGNEKVDIELVGQVKIWNKPTNPSRYQWGEEQLKKYTVPDKYWETNFPQIAEKAKELKTAKAIYDYVSSTLKYDYERAAGKLERLGASVAIKEPTRAVCMEFTDLFIALARAAGIPARELDGYAYTTNSRLKPRSFTGAGEGDKSDILHAWAQYWNAESKSWVQIDPTWGSTTGGVDYFNKLDMNHFVFVIKGLSSSEPYPAGSYKTDPAQVGDVEVVLSPAETEIIVQPQLSLNLPGELIAGLPFGGEAMVENNGNSTIFRSELSFQSQFFGLSPVDLGPVPPFSKRAVPLNSRAGSFDLSAVDQVTATWAGQSAKGEDLKISSVRAVAIKSLFQSLLPWAAGAILFAGALMLTAKFWPSLRPRLSRYLPWLLKEPT
ncbi:MAG TPA: transglutaminase family protein, partial [Patescibacteria group bacterium]|nr:transglutaminase family protein [Patescibacteria group bacterium]